MLEHQYPEVRRELAAVRTASLHRAAANARPGHLRRTIGSGLVRLGLRLAHDSDASLLVPQLRCAEEAPGGASSAALAALRLDVTRS